MVVVLNWPFFHLFILSNIGQGNEFDGNGGRIKRISKVYKNKKFKNSKNWNFSKAFCPW